MPRISKFNLFLNLNSNFFRIFTIEKDKKYFCENSVFILRAKLNLEGKNIKNIGLRKNDVNNTFYEIKNHTNLKNLYCLYHELKGIIIFLIFK